MNYGYIPDTRSPGNEGVDAYVLGISQPSHEFTRQCIALHRMDENDVKVIVKAERHQCSDEQIQAQIAFQEHSISNQSL